MSASISSRDSFGMLLVGVARRWRSALDASLAEVGLSDATWGPLVHIGRTLTEVAAHLARETAIDHPLLREAARELAKQASFFQVVKLT